MNPVARDELNDAALWFWRRAPWRSLTNDDLFGLRDEASGMTGCAVILGEAGQEFGLGLYLGARGFEVGQRLRNTEMDNDEFAHNTDLILLTFDDPRSLPKEARTSPVAFNLIKEGGRTALPMALMKPAGRTARALSDVEAGFLARALRAVLHLQEAGRLRSEKLQVSNDIVVFLLPTKAGEPIREEGVPTAPPQTPEPPLSLTASTRKRLSRKARRGALAVSLMTPGISVRDEQLRMLAVLDLESGKLLVSEALAGPSALADSADRFVELLTARESRLPVELVTDSLQFYGFVKDALSELGVRVLYQEKVPALDDVRKSFEDFMQRGGA